MMKRIFCNTMESFLNKKSKRVGRGLYSGKRSGRGMKGLKARSGHKSLLLFEGGQRRGYLSIPKRGFNNIFKNRYVLADLNILANFIIQYVKDNGELYIISLEVIKNSKLFGKRHILNGIKFLCNGTFDIKEVSCSKFIYCPHIIKMSVNFKNFIIDLGIVLEVYYKI